MKTPVTMRAFLGMCTLGTALGCGGAAGDDWAQPGTGQSDDVIGEAEQAVLGGTTVPVGSRNALELTVVRTTAGTPGNLGTGTGTLITPEWVLTARHCVNDRTNHWWPTVWVSHEKGAGYDRIPDYIIGHPDPDVDIALLHLPTPINVGQNSSVPLFTGWDADIENKTVTSYGYGGVQVLAKKSIKVGSINHGTEMNGSLIYAKKYINTPGLTPGDSGGPSFIGGKLVGVTGNDNWSVYAKVFRNWVNSVISPATNNRISTTKSSAGANWAPAGSQMRLGDVNGDGYADLIQFNQDLAPRGSVYVSLGTSSGFVGGSAWHTSFSTGAQIPLVGDIDGDGKDDIVKFDQSSGEVWAALSNGSNGFGVSEKWHSGFSYTGEIPRLGDVNGDGRADLVTFVQYNNWGTVWVAHSCGTNAAAFAPGVHCSAVKTFGGGTVGTRILWANNFSLLGDVPHVGDVDGDGLADLVTFAPDGQAYVARSQRQSCNTEADCGGYGVCWTDQKACPGSFGIWAAAKLPAGYGFFPGNEQIMLADMNGDGFTDAVSFQPGGNVNVGLATNARYLGFQASSTWGTKFCRTGEVCLVGDKDRDGRVDVFDFIRGGADVYSRSLR